MSASTTITRRYSPAGLAAVRGKVADLLRSAHKKGWNVDVTIDATEPYLRTIADRERFVVDAWITGEFDLDVPTYLTLAVETVERLNGPKVAQLIVG